MGIVTSLVVLGLALLVLLFEQWRVMRMPPEKRAQLLDRRSFGRQQPRDPDAYKRLVIIALVGVAVAGAAVVALVATSPGPGRTQAALITALVVLVVLAVFAFLGWQNHKRISEDTQSR